jgi:hypothetical protein
LATLSRVRSLRDMQTAVRLPVATMQARRAELSVVAHVTLLMDEGAGLADRIDKWKVKYDERLAIRAVAAAKAKQEGFALRATLREVRRIWRSAAIGNPLMPPLDLSLAAGAVAPRKRGSDGATTPMPPRVTARPLATGGRPTRGAPRLVRVRRPGARPATMSAVPRRRRARWVRSCVGPTPPRLGRTDGRP